MRTDDKAEEQIASPGIALTVAPTIHNKTWTVKEETEKVSQEENKVENLVKEKKENVYREKENMDTLFTKDLCAKLRVPCRFVTEHLCCRFSQRI